VAVTVKASIGDPAVLNITSYKNDSIDDFSMTILDRDDGSITDLSVYDVIMLQIKNDTESTTSLLEFSKADGSILWSVDAAGIETGDGTDGKITLRKVRNDVRSFLPGKYVWDVQFISTSKNRRNTLVRGQWNNDPDITRIELWPKSLPIKFN